MRNVSAFQVVGNRKRLQKTDEIVLLGNSERTYPLCHIENTGYGVTLQEVDPSYIVNWSIEYKLRFNGKWKLPGYSACVHSVVPDLIPSFGQALQS